MGYVSPQTVLAPKTQISNLEVIYDAGPVEHSWSVAVFEWAGRRAVGMRWNGDPHDKGIGTPQARGIPTWFVVPDELADTILGAAKQLASGDDPRLLAGYEAMAADADREKEAEEWIEGLIGDNGDSSQ